MTILPDLMQPVQTLTRFEAPFTLARTRWMFGFQRRLVRRCECDTYMPHDGPLPQTSHFDAIGFSCTAAGCTGSITLNWGPTDDSVSRDSHEMLPRRSVGPTPSGQTTTRVANVAVVAGC